MMFIGDFHILGTIQWGCLIWGTATSTGYVRTSSDRQVDLSPRHLRGGLQRMGHLRVPKKNTNSLTFAL